jgi:preprotein translocase subunit Sec61beta
MSEAKMTTIAPEAALLVTTCGLVAAVLSLAKTRQIPLSLAVLLDFFTAAGLLRLVGPPTWPCLATVALTIIVRQLASRGLRAAQAGLLRFTPPGQHIITRRQARHG